MLCLQHQDPTRAACRTPCAQYDEQGGHTSATALHARHASIDMGLLNRQLHGASSASSSLRGRSKTQQGGTAEGAAAQQPVLLYDAVTSDEHWRSGTGQGLQRPSKGSGSGRRQRAAAGGAVAEPGSPVASEGGSSYYSGELPGSPEKRPSAGDRHEGRCGGQAGLGQPYKQDRGWAQAGYRFSWRLRVPFPPRTAGNHSRQSYEQRHAGTAQWVFDRANSASNGRWALRTCRWSVAAAVAGGGRGVHGRQEGRGLPRVAQGCPRAAPLEVPTIAGAPPLQTPTARCSPTWTAPAAAASKSGPPLPARSSSSSSSSSQPPPPASGSDSRRRLKRSSSSSSSSSSRDARAVRWRRWGHRCSTRRASAGCRPWGNPCCRRRRRCALATPRRRRRRRCCSSSRTSSSGRELVAASTQQAQLRPRQRRPRCRRCRLSSPRRSGNRRRRRRVRRARRSARRCPACACLGLSSAPPQPWRTTA